MAVARDLGVAAATCSIVTLGACELLLPVHESATLADGDASTAIEGSAGDADSSCLGCVEPSLHYNYMFVTSQPCTPGTPYQPDHTTFASPEDADKICNALALASKILPHDREYHYRAWLSDATEDAYTRLPSNQGWIRPDRRPFAESREKLVLGEIYFPPRIDENLLDIDLADTPSSGTRKVATGTGLDGNKTTAQSGVPPANWGTAGPYAYGHSNATKGYWTYDPGVSITGDARLYCFGVDPNPTPWVLPKQSGRTAFVSNDAYSITRDGGLKSADDFCNAQADAGGLSGEYLAFLSTTGQAAAARFDGGSPWVRVDGMPWVAGIHELGRGEVLTTLNVAPSFAVNGSPEAYRASYAWTGSTGANSGPASATADRTQESCDDWTSASAGGSLGLSSSSFSWFFFSGMPCNQPDTHLYCLQK
jgi:hypothetical protein